MTKNLIQRITAMLAAVIMLIASIPVNLVVMGDEVTQKGIGVCNDVHQGDDVSANLYCLTFYARNEQSRLVKVPMTDSITLNDNDETVINPDGTFTVDGEKTIIFSNDEDFISFLEQNKIVRVELQFLENQSTDSSSRRLFELQSSSAKKSWINIPYTEEVNPATGEIVGYKIQQSYLDAAKPGTFTSSILHDLDVKVDWMDKDDTVRRVEDFDFTLQRSTDDGTTWEDVSYSETPVRTKVNSGLDTYTYSLPKYNAEGTQYSYRIKPESVPAVGGYSVSVDGMVVTCIREREFVVRLNWADGAVPDEQKSAVRPALAESYVLDNFNMVRMQKKADGTYLTETITLTSDNVEIDMTTGRMKVINIDEMDSDGLPYIYYLEPKTEANLSAPAQIVSGITESGDIYQCRISNPGIYSSETSKVYGGGSLNLTLTGQESFTTSIDWKDEDNEDARKQRIANGDSVGSFVIWRYVDNDDPLKYEKVAQVGTGILNSASLSGDDYETFTLTDEEGNTISLPKYDNNGNRYQYFAKGGVSLRSPDYVTTVTEGKTETVSGNQIKGGVFNDGTIAAALTGTITPIVEAEWIAAARQGGTAEIDYKLQVWDETTGQFVDLTPPASMHLGTFRAEIMTLDGSFDSYPLYDEEGRRIKYRLVQTQAVREDAQNNGGNPVTLTTLNGSQQISLKYDNSGNLVVDAHGNLKFDNGTEEGSDSVSLYAGEDIYIVTARSENGKIHFTYTLVTKVKYLISKKWTGAAASWDKSVQMDIKQYDFDNAQDFIPLQSEDYPNGAVVLPNPDFELVGSDYVCEKYVELDKYDLRGHVNIYRVYEHGRDESFPITDTDGNPVEEAGEPVLFESGKVRYRKNDEYDPEDPTSYVGSFSVENFPLVPDDDDDDTEMELLKIWMDDGELQYRAPVEIHVNDENVQFKNNTDYPQKNINGTERWTGYVPLDQKLREDLFYEMDLLFKKQREDPENNQAAYAYEYHPLDFMEFITSSTSYHFYNAVGDGKAGSQFKDPVQVNVNGTNQNLSGENWIYFLRSTAYNSHYNSTNSIDMLEQTKNWVTFPDTNNPENSPNTKTVGIFQNQGHYYLVQHRTSSYKEGLQHPRSLTIINTRIGVVSYKINFDWKVGDALSDIQGVKLKITGIGSNTSGGDDYSIEVEVDDPQALLNKDYYILNLPKYNKKGEIIEYKVEQVALLSKETDPETLGHKEYPVNDNKCTFGEDQDNCMVKISEQVYNKNLENSNSDDLIELTITNTFTGETGMKIHKLWVDDNNIENTRADLYIRLWRKTHRSQSAIAVGDYEWSGGNTNNWTYTFRHLARYDADGYEYTYYVKEVASVANYISTYINPTTIQKDEETVDNPNKNETDGAYNGGTIKNTLSAPVTIGGDKIWKAILANMNKDYYPVAEVYLYAKEKYADESGALKTYQDRYLRAGDTSSLKIEDASKGRLVAVSKIYNGDSSYQFTNKQTEVLDGVTVTYYQDDSVFKKWQNSTNFPKYDKGGGKIEYTVDEKGIAGYNLTRNGAILTNEYTGGKKITFTVHKNWGNRTSNGVFPTVRVTLHQAMRIPAGTVINGTPIPTERIIDYRTDSQYLRQGAESCTFSDVSLTDPRGNDFVYYITEQITNYMGEQSAEIYPKDSSFEEIYASLYDPNTNSFIVNEQISTEGLGYSVSGKITTNEVTGNKTMELTNNYVPDFENFEATITVDKHWNNYNVYQANQYSKTYSFILSRRTRKISLKNLFKLTVVQNGIPLIDISGDNKDSEFEMTTDADYSSDDTTSGSPVFKPTDNANVYKCVIHYKKSIYSLSQYEEYIPLIITVNSVTGHVEIKNLAEYGNDGVRYYYKATEVDLDPAFVQKQDKLNEKQVSTGANSKAKAELSLTNNLRLRPITLVKDFGAEMHEGTFRKLPTADMEQFFNQSYVNNLQYVLTAVSASGLHVFSKTVSGSSLQLMPEQAVPKTATQEQKETIENNNRYRGYTVSLSNQNLPEFAPDGTRYTYYVKENNSQNGVKVFASPSERFAFTAAVNEANASTPDTLVNDGKGVEIPGNAINFTNVLPARQIHIAKNWEDNGNADGVRPEAIKVHICELNAAGTQVNAVDRFLSNDPTVSQNGNWLIRDVYVPRVYFYQNTATPVNAVKLTEDDQYYIFNEAFGETNAQTDEFKPDGTKTLSANGYTEDTSSGTLAQYPNQILLSDSADTLYISNKRERYSGKIDLTKFWAEDNNNQWQLRPDQVYFKVKRKLEGSADDFVDVTSVNNTRNLTILNRDGTPAAAAVAEVNQTIGLITVKLTPDKTVPAVTVADLIYGANTGGTSDSNGTFTKYVYKLIECDSTGNELNNETGTFSYTWEAAFQNVASTEAYSTTNFQFKKFFTSENVDSTEKTIYLVLQRRKEGESTYENVTELLSYNYETETETEIKSSPSGVMSVDFTDVEAETEETSPTITITTPLPVGVNDGGTGTEDGTFRRYTYRVVEADENGVLLREDGSFRLTSLQHGSPVQLVSADPVTNDEVDMTQSTLLVSTTGTKTEAKLDSHVTNTLKKVNYRAVKTWDDERDYYATRSSYTLQLQYSVDNGTTWNDAIHLNNANGSVEINDSTQRKNGITLPESDTFEHNTQFMELPKYDKNGNEYQYRVVETKIGTYPVIKDQGDTTYHTHNYNVTYENDSTPYTITTPAVGDEAPAITEYIGTTKITNSTRTNPNLKNIVAQKIWDDNNNQDGKRTPVTFSLKQTYTDGEAVEHTTIFAETVDQTDWYYVWTNMPMYSPDNYPYSYTVVETIPGGYTLENGTTVGTEGRVTSVLGKVPDSDDDANVYTFENKYTPAKQKLTVEKTWDDLSNQFGLRPEKVKFTLYAKYDVYVETSRQTNATTHKTQINYSKSGEVDKPVSELQSSVTPLSSVEYEKIITSTNALPTNNNKWKAEFTDLPVWLNPTGTPTEYGQSVPVTYYVKEELLNSDDTTYATNVYTCTTDPTNQYSTKVQLISGGAAADNTAKLTNKLNTRDIMVKKAWEDNGYTDGSTLHYDLDITLSNSSLSCSEASRSDAGKYKEIKSLPVAQQNAGKGVIFRNLPKYDSDGNEIVYQVTEAIASTTPAHTAPEADYAAFASGDGTAVANGVFTVASRKYGYEGSCKELTDAGLTTQYNITNTLPVMNFKAELLWEDDNNRDGKRPEESAGVSLSLQRYTGSNTPVTVGSPAAAVRPAAERSKEAGTTLWNVSFGAHPKYDEGNNLYTYKINQNVDVIDYASTCSPDIPMVSEALSAEGRTAYSDESESIKADRKQLKSVLKDDCVFTTNAEAQKQATFRVRNTYIPQKRNLTVNKSWSETVDGVDYSAITRPASVSVTLVIDDEISEQIKSLTPNNWQNSFNGLFVKKNNGGTDTNNGTSSIITYSVAEKVPTAYTAAYSPSGVTLDSADQTITVTNTLKQKTVTVEKLWEDGLYQQTQGNTHYAVSADIKLSGFTKPVQLPLPASGAQSAAVTLPEYVLSGTNYIPAEYTIQETTFHYGYADTYSVDNSTYQASNSFSFIPHNGQTHVYIKNTLPLKQIKVVKNWVDDNNRDGYRPESLSFTLSRTPQGTNNAAVNDTDSAAVTGNWQKLFTNYYLVKDYAGNEYTYHVTEGTFANASQYTKTTYGTDPDIVDYQKTTDTSGEIPVDIYTFENTHTIEKGSLQVGKNWVGDESYKEKVRPAGVRVKLMCSYGGGAKHAVEGDTNITSQLPSGYVYEQVIHNGSTVTFSDLPLNVNTTFTPQSNGTKVPVTYSVEEVVDANSQYQIGTDTYSLIGYTRNDSAGTTLTKDGTNSIMVTNTLKTGSIKVQKIWNLNGFVVPADQYAAYHYDVAVKLESDAVNYNQNHTIHTTSGENGMITVSGLPLYDKNGSQAQYSVTELTSPKYGYVVTKTNDTGLVPTENAASAPRADITNTLPVTRFTAHKVWDDNSNQDGKRPESLQYTVTRKLNGGSEDANFSAVTDTAANASNWADVNFAEKTYPTYQADNQPYTYEMTEAAIANYTSSSSFTTTTADNITTIAYTFNNVYTPKTKTITVTKDWIGEGSFAQYTRPGKIYLRLYCSYGATGKQTLDNAGISAVKTLVQPSHAEYLANVEIDTSADGTTRFTCTFSDLPVSVNPTGTATNNGQAQQVTYYVEEVGAGTGNLIGYTTTVQPQSVTPGETNGTVQINNTLRKGEVILTKNWEDSHTADDTHYDIKADIKIKESGSFVNNVVTNVNIPKDSHSEAVELPIYYKDGSPAVYKAKETTGKQFEYTENQETQEFSVDTNDATTQEFVITNTLPVKQFTADKVWKDDNNRDGYRPGSLDLTLQRTIDSSTWENVQTLAATPSNQWKVDYGFRPTHDSQNRLYTYRIVEATNYQNNDQYALIGTEIKYYNTENVLLHTDTHNDANLYSFDPSKTAKLVNYEFTNEHTIEKGNLNLAKTWTGDEIFNTWTRPDSVTVELWCKFNGTDQKVSAVDRLSTYVSDDSQYTISASTWKTAVNNLPLKINVVGTGIVNGTSYPVTYYMKEIKDTDAKLNGYTLKGYAEGTATPALNFGGVTLTKDGTKNITVTNELITRPLKLKKAWNDQSSAITTDHDAVNAKVTLNYTDASAATQYTTSVTGIDASGQYTTPELPLYTRDGQLAHYTVEETSVHNYEYIPSYSADDFTLNTENTDKEITITNTLPVVQITLTKTWNDGNNQYQLRPSDIRGQLTLQQKLNTEADSAYVNISVTPTLDKTTGTNIWTITYPNLPQYSKDRVPYVYRVVENDSAIPGYYSTNTNSMTAATEPASGTVQSNTTRDLSLENKLITKDVTIKKSWNDNGYERVSAESLHYNIDVTLSKAVEAGKTPVALSFDGTIEAQQSEDGGSVILSGVPVYDLDGNVINYTVSEKPTGKNYTPYGYHIPEGNTENGVTSKVVYHDSHKNLDAGYSEYTITNELPLTTVVVNKNWSNTETYNQYYHDDNYQVTVNLTRTSAAHSADVLVDTSSNLSRNTPVSFEKLLVFDERENMYTYKVTENAVKGYTTSYVGHTTPAVLDSPGNTAAATEKEEEVFTITNTEITGNAEFKKIDETFYDQYKDRSDYKDKVLPNASFRVYIKNGSMEINVPLRLNNGQYVFDTSSDNSVVTSDADGMIRLQNLPPNTYYLKETAAPMGYDLSIKEYSFTVDVASATATTANPKYVGNFVTAAATDNRIGNVQSQPPEDLTRLTLIKQDATDSTRKLSGATYKLLQLIPYSFLSAEAQATYGDESAYVAAAKAAVADSNGTVTTDVSKFWNEAKDKNYQTDANGQITVDTVPYGIYTFLEIQAPIGYQLNNNIDPVEISPTNRTVSIVHDDPRKDAKVQIQKLDEFGNGLNDATFELWYRPGGNPLASEPSVPDETTSVQQITPRSDWDYIFFTDNNQRWIEGHIKENGGWEKDNDDVKIYAYFFNSSSDYEPAAWPGIEMWERYVNENNEVVYKVQPPEGVDRVVFSSGQWINSEYQNVKQTVDITFRIGEGYYKDGQTESGYTVGTWHLSTNDPIPTQDTVSYTPTTNKVVFTCNHNRDWDDIHIEFFTDAAGTDHVGMNAPGYLMEPYGTGKDEYGHLQYELTIPQGANYFRINNGTKPSGYTHNSRYYTAITAIADDSSKLNNGNYWHFDPSYATWYENGQLALWDVMPDALDFSEPEHLSDHDYIYFTAPDGWITQEHPTMYAYYYSGGPLDTSTNTTACYTVWPGIAAVGQYKNNIGSGQTIYKFQIPKGDVSQYSAVVFNNGKNGEHTASPNYSLGTGYYVNGDSLGTWPVDQGHTTVSYTKRNDADYLYFKMEDNNVDSSTYWDDPHVVFYNDSDAVIGQTSPGYLPTYCGEDEDNKRWYKIHIPQGAVSFELNNGYNKGSHNRSTGRIDISEETGSMYYAVETTKTGDNYNLTLVYPATINPKTFLEGDIKLATIVTDYNGLPKSVTIADGAETYAGAVNSILGGEGQAVSLKNWGTYYFKEITSPTGYTYDDEYIDTFVIDAEQADKTVNIINASNTRIPGKVQLTKTAKEAAGGKKIGDPLSGAEFSLYRKSDTTHTTPLQLLKKTDTAEYTFVEGLEAPVINGMTGYEQDGSNNNKLYTTLTTDVNGIIKIDNLEWGDYYLLETTAPSGFVTTDSNTTSANRVDFTVGRNNCQDYQQLTCRNEAAKAKIKITKTIDDRVAAWGDPTFIFRLCQKEQYVNGVLSPVPENEQTTLTVSMTLAAPAVTGTKELEVEPGTYEVVEVQVSRYELNICTITDQANVTNKSVTGRKATLTIGANGEATVNYDNRISYYDKFSQVGSKVNEVRGYKGIQVSYPNSVDAVNNPAVIPQTDLTASWIRSDGSLIPMSEAEKNALNITYVPGTRDDLTFADNYSVENNAIKVTNPSRYTDSVYTLQASVTYSGVTFTDQFTLSFAKKDNQIKAYQYTVLFKADAANRTYFVEDASSNNTNDRTAQYAFVYTVVQNGSNFEIFSVTHNGKAVDRTEILNIVGNALKVNNSYAPAKEFDSWQEAIVNIAQIEAVVTTAGQEGTKTYTAVLKDKT